MNFHFMLPFLIFFCNSHPQITKFFNSVLKIFIMLLNKKNNCNYTFYTNQAKFTLNYRYFLNFNAFIK